MPQNDVSHQVDILWAINMGIGDYTPERNIFTIIFFFNQLLVTMIA